MKLTFSILWFDDSSDWLDSLDLEPLETEISSWGFDAKINKVMTPEDFRGYSPFKDIDLIVVDRYLEQYPEGQEFIAELRSHAIYTEVIFYTSGMASELWDAIYKKQLEGVFVSNRNDILSKISKVGRQSIQKVLDLENIRGIVMAEVGELDHLLEEIIKVGIESLLVEQQTAIFKKFHEGAAKQNQEIRDRLTRFSSAPRINEMLDLCDSDKRWQNFNRLWKSHRAFKGKDKILDFKIGDFSAEVLKPRNFLAHGRPEYQNDGSYVFRYQEKEFHFTDEVSLELRQTILGYKQAFSKILEILNSLRA